MSIFNTRYYVTGLIRPALKSLVFGIVAVIPTVGISLPSPAATETSETAIFPAALTLDAPIQIAQAAGSTVLNVEYPRAYTVRIYDVGNGQLRTNVFQRLDDVLEANGAPTTFRGYPGDSGFAEYVANYNYQGERKQAQIRYNPTTRQATLVIFNETLDVADFEESRAQRVITAQVPPPGDLTPAPEGITAAAFETPDYAVRVFTSTQGARLMNVFSKQTGRNLLRNQPVEVLRSAPPNVNAVRYSAIGTFNNAPAQYIARIEPGSNNTQLTIIGTDDGRVFVSEAGQATVVQIPNEDLYGGGTPLPPTTDVQLNPYVAAVFGNESTLAQIRQEAVPSAQFEDTDLGRFINAGSFRDRNRAASLVNYLRSLGYNSRLVYRDFNYR